MKKIRDYTKIFPTIVGLCITILFFGCPFPNGNNQQEETGTIEGAAYYQNATSHGGITISIEGSDGLRTASVTRSVRTSSITRQIAGSTTTDTNGRYLLVDIDPGTYTLYASSKDSREKAVSTNITVREGRTVTAADLNLTAVGHISGTIQVDGTSTGNRGFFVFIEGTSYMAVTNDSGDFTISDVPAGSSYSIVISKGTYVRVWKTSSVSAGNTTTLSTLSVTTNEITDSAGGIEWQGSLSSAPSNPEKNWAYYDTTDGSSYIWDGDSWETLAKDGSQGPAGQDGVSIIWQGQMVSAPDPAELNWAYYNTSEGISYIYNGSGWDTIARDGQDGAAGLDGVSILWQGELASAPDPAELNWAYYNTIEGRSYIYNGSDWDILAQDGGINDVVAPVLIPGGTTFDEPVIVTMFTTTAGAEIRYTSDGTTTPDETTGTVYTEPILLDHSQTIMAVAYKTGMTTSGVNTQAYTVNIVETPTFSLAAGTYDAIQDVTIGTATTGATVYYTTDETDPSSENYTGSGTDSVVFSLDRSMEVRAIAVKTGFMDSGIASASYTLENVVEAPQFSLTEQYYTSPTDLTITCATSGAMIYYTTDNSTPSSSNYAGYGESVTVTIDTSMTVKAIAINTGYTDSAITSRYYEITGQVAAPAFTPGAGVYVPPQNIDISSATSGSTIYYTVDGTEPSELNYDGTASETATATLTASATLKAIAVKENWDNSTIASGDYTLTSAVADPTYTPAAGLYNSSQSITIETATTDATIYYTTDGTDPSSSNYAGTGTGTANITVDASQTVQAIAVKSGMPDSSIVEAVYTIDTEPPVITLNGADSIMLVVNEDTYTEQGASATDNHDGTISGDIVIGGDTVDTTTVGTYTVTYDVTDSAGNPATQVTRVVEVIAGETVLPFVIRDTSTDFHTLTAANSPYAVQDMNCRIDTGVTVSIEPGVIIKFDPGTQLLVDGELIAVGTAADPIVFTNASGDPWNNVEFSSLSVGSNFDPVSRAYLDGSRLAYCDFENGGSQTDYGMLQLNETALYVSNCTFSGSSGHGVFMNQNDSTDVERNVFESCSFTYNARTGLTFWRGEEIVIDECVVEGNSVDDPVNPYTGIDLSFLSGIAELTNTTIRDDRVGIGANCPVTIHANTIEQAAPGSQKVLYLDVWGDLTFTDNRVADCATTYDLVYIDTNHQNTTFTNNTFEGNLVSHDTAHILVLYDIGNPTHFTGNVFTDNVTTTTTGAESAILFGSYNQDTPDCTGNTFLNPDFTYEVRTDSGFHSSAYVIDCSGSWWGTTTEMEILDRIYDYYDDNTLMIIEHHPWATAPLP